ncbi:MAG: tetratricopeptide repeat protein [Deltaproteobacteria bacterium]|nr:tetratricopeptide repeat protein [Deltaproteobacteria bacterium]
MKPISIFRFILFGLSWGAMVAALPNAAATQQAGGGAPILLAQEKSAMDFFVSGGAHLDQGNLDQAIADYTEAIQLKPDFFVAYLNRGTAQRKKGEVDLAIADYTQAIQLKSNLYDAYTLRGICFGKKGRYEEAIADLTKALEKKPHYLTYHGLAWIFATSKNDKYRNGARALELAQKAVLIHKNANSLDTLAAAYAETGRFKEAIETQEEALYLLKKQGSVPKEDLARYDQHLQAYKGNKPWRE